MNVVTGRVGCRKQILVALEVVRNIPYDRILDRISQGVSEDTLREAQQDKARPQLHDAGFHKQGPAGRPTPAQLRLSECATCVRLSLR